MLESGCSNRELNCALSGLAAEEGVDKTAAEGVTATYAGKIGADFYAPDAISAVRYVDDSNKT